MNEVEKEQVKSIIQRWLVQIDKKEKLPKGIISPNFGLFEPYGIELIGSKSYDVEDDIWACNEDFEPKQRICPNLNIPNHIAWQVVLQDISNILKDIIITCKK
jgi:shikimate kinase